MWNQISAVVRNAKRRSKARRAYAHLANLDDALLRDIGIARGDIYSSVFRRD